MYYYVLLLYKVEDAFVFIVGSWRMGGRVLLLLFWKPLAKPFVHNSDMKRTSKNRPLISNVVINHVQHSYKVIMHFKLVVVEQCGGRAVLDGIRGRQTGGKA